jgi:hypothetical protein
MTFAKWMEKVDNLIAQETDGFTSADLPDYCYYDAWAANLEPEDIIDEVLENASF